MSDLERVPNVFGGQEVAAENAVEVGIEEGNEGETGLSSMMGTPEQVVASESASHQQPVADPAANDPRVKLLKKVEDILASGLMELYVALPADRKAQFKAGGERVANAVTDLIVHGKASVKKVWKLLSEWLRNLPGVNKYFIQQEIKIKTDQVMFLAHSSLA